MKISRFSLKAFGPFTDRILDFHSNGPGLHIIYGPNEAGKSSSLRALHALLFGFGQQSPDNFLHSYDQLLVGGELVRTDGQRLRFWRRKRRVGDLLDDHGELLDAEQLRPFLQGVQPDIFNSLFGLDHERLVAGGRDMLAEKGEIGQALFGAGTGLGSLREFTASLQAEADELYKPSGQKPLINQALKRYRELEKQIRETSLPGTQYREISSRHDQLLARREELEKDREAKEKERFKLERMVQAIPELNELTLRRKQLAELGEVTMLAPGFSEQYARLRDDEQKTVIALDEVRRQLQSIREQAESGAVDNRLLAIGDQIHQLHERLGEYRKGQQDKPQRDGMRQSYRAEAAQLLRLLRPDMNLEGVDELRPLLTRKRTVARLSKEQAAIDEQLRRCQQAMRVHTQELKRLEAANYQKLDLPDTDGLQAQVKQCRQAGNIDSDICKKEHEIEGIVEKCAVDLQRLGLFCGSLDDIVTLPLPLVPTVQKFVDLFHELQTQERQRLDEHRSLSEEIETCRRELAHLDGDNSLPSPQELEKIRFRRNEDWQLIRENWLTGKAEEEITEQFGSKEILADDYRRLSLDADELADSLREEADRVAAAASLGKRIITLSKKLEGVSAISMKIRDKRISSEGEWRRVWEQAGITPLAPVEMMAWLNGMTNLRDRVVEQLLVLRREKQYLLEQRQQLRSRLLEELKVVGGDTSIAGDSLDPVLSRAETVLEQQQKHRMAREKSLDKMATIRSGLRALQEEHALASQSREQWQKKWQEAVDGLGLTSSSLPDEGEERMEMLERCFQNLREADTLQKRISGIERDAQYFLEDSRSLLHAVAPDLLEMPPEQSLTELRRRLTHEQESHARRREQQQNIERLQNDVKVLEERLLAVKGQVMILANQAGCQNAEHLPQAIARYNSLQELQQKIADTEAKLARITGGRSIEQLYIEAQSIETDGLPGRIETLRRSVEEDLNPQMNKISQEIGEIRAELARMDGNSQAAAFAEEKSLETAKLKRLVDRFVVIKLAAKLLQEEVENYRQRNQGPLLELGSRYFHALTRGSFSGLRSDTSDKGEMMLVGVRDGDRRLGVAEMSSGTRDQLYLALRFAALDWRLQNHEPFPFIVDDILINFDDERSKATLQVMAKLAARNQIILFTHHLRIVEQAEAAAGKNEILIHAL